MLRNLFIALLVLLVADSSWTEEGCNSKVYDPFLTEDAVVEKWADSEDDVVAAQIREVAAETLDPCLRRKLWNEYHKYKGRDRSAMQPILD